MATRTAGLEPGGAVGNSRVDGADTSGTARNSEPSTTKLLRDKQKTVVCSRCFPRYFPTFFALPFAVSFLGIHFGGRFVDKVPDQSEITDRVIEFFSALFERIFSEPFSKSITRTLKRKEVLRQVDQAADAASQSLTRLFLNERLRLAQAESILEGLGPFLAGLDLGRVGSPNLSPESLAESLLAGRPLPPPVTAAGHEPLFRIALHGILQGLTLVGPIMAEWQRLAFSATYELPRRVVDRLNRISEQIDALGRSVQDAADERFDLLHRDYLLQRFHRVEAGTVRMTTSLDVDLRELFVMARVLVRAEQDGPGW